jgi:putative hemolysin
MDILIILVLTLINGLLALGEMSIVSSRKTRLQQLAEEGNTGARMALDLANSPSRFLSTVQVGITAITILSGAFGEASLSKQFAHWLQQFAWLTPYQEEIGVVIVVGFITFLTVVFGELVPKRAALSAPEKIACVAAGPLTILSTVFRPFVRLFSASSDIVLRLFGIKGEMNESTAMSEEEIKVMIQQGAQQGELEQTEEQLVRNVFRLDDLRVAAIMTHRVNIYFLDVDAPEDVNRALIAKSPYSRIPVCKGGTDQIIGVIKAKDLLARTLAGEKLDLVSAAIRPIFVPGTITAMQLLENFQASKSDVAFVVDEYGEVQGIATLADVMQAIVGDVAVNNPKQENMAMQREDGSWLVDGALPLEHLEELLGFDREMHDDEDHYHTVAGFIMTKLGRVPQATDSLEWHEMKFEVLDMDRNRVDKVLVQRLPKPEDARDPASSD